MSIVARLLAANNRYAATYRLGALHAAPRLKLALIACMDARFDPLRVMGLRAGDAHIIRNAGGRASDDAMRSLIASTLLLGTTQVIVIHHTDCGMMATTGEALGNEVRRRLDADPSGIDFMTFTDLEQSVRDDVESIRSSPFLPAELRVSGLIYDVRTGRLREVG